MELDLHLFSDLALPLARCLGCAGFHSRTVRERLCSRVVGRDEHWDRPYVQGTSQPRAVSKSSESVVQAALQELTCDYHSTSNIVTGCLPLQGLTCEKKTESILVKAANLYSE